MKNFKAKIFLQKLIFTVDREIQARWDRLVFLEKLEFLEETAWKAKRLIKSFIKRIIVNMNYFTGWKRRNYQQSPRHQRSTGRTRLSWNSGKRTPSALRFLINFWNNFREVMAKKEILVHKVPVDVWVHQ